MNRTLKEKITEGEERTKKWAMGDTQVFPDCGDWKIPESKTQMESAWAEELAYLREKHPDYGKQGLSMSYTQFCRRWTKPGKRIYRKMGFIK